MKPRASVGDIKRRQHPDFNLRPDSGVIWQDELAMDWRHPERMTMIRISIDALWATIRAGLFPRPVTRYRRCPGWLLMDVREWLRTRDTLDPATASPYDEIETLDTSVTLTDVRQNQTRSDRHDDRVKTEPHCESLRLGSNDIEPELSTLPQKVRKDRLGIEFPTRDKQTFILRRPIVDRVEVAA